MRLPVIRPKQMSRRQAEISARIAGRRGSVRGPFRAWLHSPELCDRVEALGAFVRFESSLPPRLRELALLMAARHFDAQYSWNAHVDKARAAGIPQGVIDDLAANRTPKFQADDERVYYTFAMEMLKNHFVSDATFAEARKIFGDRGVVDLIGAIGYFSMLQICLNCGEVDLQVDRTPPFADVRGYRKV